ncbi:M4 family metallopeptidase [Streptomyces tirandamycinicus]|uniref:Peptidase M4 family protein n=1 Tax=Streptomyces tirandamycinicus TaxID=2174846 RepID=A0A2S1SXD8_9ACTN|nr:M4 family metallopeptidase [Streptomyces tirandamycinicus]AWI30927.1 peptidase M4 family protein [Streptomyces tirandamycinicus]
MRKPRHNQGRPAHGITRGTGAAALLAAAGLLITAVPAQAATPPPAPPVEVVPGEDTATPALVEGLKEPVDAKAAPADAARGHLEARESRYRIAEPRRDLTPVRTLKRGADETVRLQQRHRGVPVLGGQYVVRMEKSGGERVVTGTSGKYFTGLTTGTEATVAEDVAVRRAVSATAARLGGSRLTEADAVREEGEKSQKARSLTGTARGLVVIPRGEGVLARHVTVRGTDPVTGEPVLEEVYVDARSGFPVLRYSGIKSVTGASRAATRPERAGAAPAAAAADEPAVSAAKGSGLRLDGGKVDLELTLDGATGRYGMTDRARMADTTKNTLGTWDASSHDVGDVAGRWPSGIRVFESATAEFGKAATDAGAVDAHWAAGQVYDYFRKQHGRNGLDGRGSSVNSLVGVTLFGGSYVNAFWDGQKMVYGSGDEEFKPLAADLDVVGHEMTHGIVENTANLVYAGQSGALNEAVADYFGNAIDVTASGRSMDDPDAGLIGEDLCRTKGPRDCALRDLDDGATTSKNFLGVTFATDNGGVHLNSTVFSGALWDMRQDLGGELADRIVYKALSEYMTPLDGFTEGRNAVLAAARDLGATAKQRNVVKRSFSAHGIVPGWEDALGADSDRLLGKLNTSGTGVQAGGGWWTASQSNDDGSEPYSVYAGRADGSGHPKLISPNDGRFHVSPATDGKTVVWAAYGATSLDVLSRPLAGGPIKKLYTTTSDISGLRVENGVVVFESYGIFGDRHVGYLRPGDTRPTYADGGSFFLATALPSISQGRIAYAKLYPGETGYRLGVEVLDLGTGTKTLTGQLGEPQSLGQTGINSQHVFWLTDENLADTGQAGVRRADLDGRNVFDIAPEAKPRALHGVDLTVSEDAVTVTSQTPDTQWRNETLSKLWQLTTDGSRLDRVSCNRGEQLSPAAVSGRQVVWLDGTTGFTDLVTRTRPAGLCG